MHLFRFLLLYFTLSFFPSPMQNQCFSDEEILSQCLFCDYQYYETNYCTSLNMSIISANFMLNSSDCVEKIPIPLNRKVFVLSFSSNIVPNSSDFDNIYSSIYDAFYQESIASCKYLFITLNITLQSGVHYVSKENQTGYFFRRTLMDVIIENENEIGTTKIIMNSTFFYIFVSNYFIVRNIIFEGVGFVSSNISSIYNGIYGLFNLEFIFDNPNITEQPHLVLENCSFINFQPSNDNDFFMSLFSLAPLSGILEINFSQILNCFFPSGLITNSLLTSENLYFFLLKILNIESFSSLNQTIIIENCLITFYENLFNYNIIVNSAKLINLYNFYGNVTLLNLTITDLSNIFAFLFISNENNCSYIYSSVLSIENVSESRIYDITNCNSITMVNSSFQNISYSGEYGFFFFNSFTSLYFFSIEFSTITLPTLIELQLGNATLSNINFNDLILEEGIIIDSSNVYIAFMNVSKLIFSMYFLSSQNGKITRIEELEMNQIQGNLTIFSLFYTLNQSNIFFINSNFDSINVNSFIDLSQTLFFLGEKISITNSFFNNFWEIEPDCSFILFSNSLMQSNFFYNSIYYNSIMKSTNLKIQKTLFKNNNSTSAQIQLVFAGEYYLDSSSFENTIMLDPNVFEKIFDFELHAQIYIHNSYFHENGLIQKKTYYLTKVDNCLFSLWSISYTYFNQITVVITQKNELASGIISAVPHGGAIQISNSFFIILDTNPNFYYKGFYLDTVLEGVFNNNTFLNLICNNLTFFHAEGSFLLTGSPHLNYVENDYFAVFFDNVFVNCSCFFGGSLAVVGINNVTMKNMSFYNSSALNDGGHLFLVSNMFMYLINVTLVNSEAKSGGALYSENIKEFLILNMNMSYAISSSGGISCSDVYEITILKSNFNNNEAHSQGGVIYILNSFLTMNESSLINSKADLEGGIGYFTGQSNLDLGYLCIENSSSNTGGGFYLDDTLEGKFSFMTIKNASSTFNGAAFYIDIALNISMNNLYLSNSVTENNGILYIICEDDASEIRIQKFTIQSTLAKKGSFIYFLSSATIYLTQINLIETNVPTISLWSFFQKTAEIENLLILKTFGDDNIFIVNGIDIQMTTATISQTNHSMSCFSFEASNSSVFNVNFINNYNEQFAFESTSSTLMMENLIINNFGQINNLFSFLSSQNSNISLTNGIIQSLFSFSGQIIYLQNGVFSLENVNFSNNGPSQVIFGNDILLSLRNCVFLYNSPTSSNIEISFIQKDLNNEVTLWNTTIAILFDSGLKITGTPFNLSLQLCNFTSLKQNLYEITGLQLQNCFILNIENSIFQNFSQNSLILQKDLINLGMETFINILHTFFINNKGSVGSAIYIKSFLFAYFFNCSFIRNQAVSNHGMAPCMAFFTDSFLSENSSKIIFLSSTFINNTSEFIAPTIYSEIPVENINNTFINNQDASNFSSYFFSLNLTLNSLVNQTKFLIKSGISFNLEIKITDFYGQILNFDNKSTITLMTGSDFKISVENNLFQANQGLFLLKNLVVKVNSNTSFPLYLEANFPEIQNETTKSILIESQQILLEVQFQSSICSIGEILKEDLSCEICQNGSFSLIDPMLNDSLLLNCYVCPPNADCFNGKFVTPQAGFYKYSNISLTITSCFNSDACLGFTQTPYNYLCDENCQNNIIIHGACASGTSGELCFYCTIGYFKSGSSLSSPCISCENVPLLNYFEMIIIIVGTIMFLLSNGISAESVKLNEGVFENYNTMNKILINHFQQISIIFNPNSIPLGFILDFLNIFKIFSFPLDIFNNRCSLQHAYFNPVNDFIVNAVVFILTPFVISGLGAFIRFLISFLKKLILKNRNYEVLSWSDIYNKFRLYFVICIFMYYPQIIKTYLSFFNCQKIDNALGISVLKVSPNLQCWKDFHYKISMFLGLPGLILSGLVSQAYLFIVLLFYNKISINTNKNINEFFLSKKKNSVFPIKLDVFNDKTKNMELLKKIQTPDEIFDSHGSNMKRNENSSQILRFSDNAIAEEEKTEVKAHKEFLKKKSTTYHHFEQLLDYFQNFKNDLSSSKTLNKKHEEKIKTLFSVLSIKHEKFSDHSQKLKALKNYIQSVKNSRVFCFFYKDFDEEHYYWECAIFLRKFFLCVFVNLTEILPDEVNNLFLLLILFIFILITMFTKPYLFNKANNLEVHSLCVCVYSLLASILINSNINDNVKMVFAVIFFTSNLHFMIMCAVHSFCDIKDKLKEKNIGKLYQHFLKKMVGSSSLRNKGKL